MGWEPLASKASILQVLLSYFSTPDPVIEKFCKRQVITYLENL